MVTMNKAVIKIQGYQLGELCYSEDGMGYTPQVAQIQPLHTIVM